MIIIIPTIKYGSTYYNTFTTGVCSNFHGYFFQCDNQSYMIRKKIVAVRYVMGTKVKVEAEGSGYVGSPLVRLLIGKSHQDCCFSLSYVSLSWLLILKKIFRINKRLALFFSLQ